MLIHVKDAHRELAGDHRRENMADHGAVCVTRRVPVQVLPTGATAVDVLHLRARSGARGPRVADVRDAPEVIRSAVG